ncbi:Surface presentation of antigens (SPOA) [Shimia sp. SK013]|uniref:FliM/FliN family flagellar motor C-terminal domain-containing protein n=1 Tax=Shimia sp. SK013 TaxID=1389006 RepID=UPI0006CC81A0|nr:FliM/FliN family flagellar motor C-terminal domain-containing protein [Shimia sp. SK013]KPA23334.1 Surface presentation of antigens (SPOA) [Shimia sp. SK013]
MGDAANSSILRRKALDGLSGHKARSMSPEKAIRLGMALSAQNGMGLACEVTKVQRGKVSHETLVGMLDSDCLLAVLEGENGARAALAIDLQVLSGLVEHQTLGRVLPSPASPRPATLVDAALVTPVIEDTLARFVSLLNTDEAPKWLQHYKFGAVTDDTRTLSLSLKAHDFHFMMLDVTLDGGAKAGTIGLAFPDFELDVEEPEEVQGEDTKSDSFQAKLLRARATLTGVVGRLNMSIGEMQALQVGQIVPLSSDAMKETTLETSDGARVTEVSLGQINGMRAVRLVEAIIPVQPAEDADMDGGFPPLAKAPAAAPTAAAPMEMPAPTTIAPVMPDLPDLPDFPDLPDMGDPLADLGDFDLDDLGASDLPELPDFADLDMTGT